MGKPPHNLAPTSAPPPISDLEQLELNSSALHGEESLAVLIVTLSGFRKTCSLDATGPSVSHPEP
jgi:hypothetical protein